MSNSLKKAQEQIDMDMTPMIDCVFLLMIFFVLVIDLSQKNLEDLILPKAEFKEPDDTPPDNRPIINVLQDGAVVWEKEVVYDPADPAKRDPKLIVQLLQDIKKAVKLNYKDEVIGGKTVRLVDDPVLIRADKWTEWNVVGEIMKQCSQPEAAFWKLELAMSDEDKEVPKKRK